MRLSATFASLTCIVLASLAIAGPAPQAGRTETCCKPCTSSGVQVCTKCYRPGTCAVPFPRDCTFNAEMPANKTECFTPNSKDVPSLAAP
jgi:hypothetical protein